MAPWGPCWLHAALACHNAALRSAAAPGPSTDQEALQEDFLGPLQALGGSAGNGRLRDLLTWEEATYEAVKASLLASGRLRRGRGGSMSRENGAGDEGADGSASEAAESFAEPRGSVAAAEGSLAAAVIGKASALSAPPPGPVRPATGPVPQCPQPSGKQNLSAFIWSVADRLRGDYKQSDYGKVILPFTVLPARLRAGAQQHLDSE